MNRILWISFGAILFFTSTRGSAEIPITASLEKLTAMSKTRFFIEAHAEKVPGSRYFSAVERLAMLEQLLARKNNPPDFVSALEVALPNATIAHTDPDILRVVDKSLTKKQLETFESEVKINGYSGRVGDLFSSLTLGGYSVILDQLIVLPGTDVQQVIKMNFEVKQLSFTGSLRGLLAVLASQVGPQGSYGARLHDDSRIIVRFFPIQTK